MPHDPRLGPDPDALHPLPGHPRVTVLRNLALPPNVEIGAYTYYDDPAELGFASAVSPALLQVRSCSHAK